MKKLCTLTIIILISIFSLIGCSSSNSKESTSTTENTNSVVYKDGTYKGTYYKYDKSGWKAQMNVTIQGSKIAKIDFNYVNKNGKLKTEDDNYEKAMKAKKGIGPKEFIPKLNQQLISSQTASKIDVITGATVSSTEFKELSKAVLDKAKTGDTSQTILTRK
jgi:major membrane immunogen (membrane-anchored lipoprotein)